MSAYRSGSGQLEEENALLRVECRRVAELEEEGEHGAEEQRTAERGE